MTEGVILGELPLLEAAQRRALKVKCQRYSKTSKRKHALHYLPFHLDHTQQNTAYVMF